MKKLLLHFLILVSMFSGSLIAFVPNTADASVMIAPSSEALQLLATTNSIREANRVTDLQINGALTAAAEAKAADMIANNYWAHVSPSGITPWNFIDQTGYQYVGAGENLAYGFTSLSDVMTGWMNSASHRANVLKAAYSEVGFSVVTAADFMGSGPQTIVVAEYGIPTEAPAPTAASVNAAPTPAAAEQATASLTPPTAVSLPAAPVQSVKTFKVAASKKIDHKITPSLHATNAFGFLAVGLTTPSLYIFHRRTSKR